MNQRITPKPPRGQDEDTFWLRRCITANLRLHASPAGGLDATFIRVSLGRTEQEVSGELRRMRDEGLAACYEAGDGRGRRTRWYLTVRGARR